MCNQSESSIQTIINPLKKLLKEFDLRESEGRKEYLGYPFKDYKELNRIISGIRTSNLTLLATSSNNLRSQFMLQIAISIICETRTPILYLCFEESPENLLKQILSQQTGLSINTIERNKIKSNLDLKESLKKGLEKFAKFQSYLNLVACSQNDTMEQLEIHLRSFKERYKSEKVILMVDTLQRIPSYNYYSSEVARVSDIGNRLKLLAHAQRVAVFAGSEITVEGQEIDATDNKDRITPEHCYGNPNLDRFADVVMTVSKSWIDSTELKILLQKKAEFAGMKGANIPSMAVLDLYVDKLPNSHTKQSFVQFLAMLDNGLLTELGCFDEKVLLRQNRIDKALSALIEQKVVEFLPKNFEKSASLGSSDTAGTGSLTNSLESTGMQDQQEKKKIKPSIKLNR